MRKKLLGMALLIITIAVVVVMVKSKKRPEFNQQQASSLLKLLTLEISPTQEQIVITANGNLTAQWQTELKSQVSGAIVSISDKLLVGAAFAQGDVLLQIDATDYEANVSRAKANLALAQERLVEEQTRADRALSDWKSLNSNKQANDYTLRKPQLNSAQMNLLAAQADLQVAESNLAKTQITAPYAGFIATRLVDLGETVQIGSSIAEVFSSQALTLTLPLTNQQVEMLESSSGYTIEVFDLNNLSKTWEATLDRIDQSIDQQSRWRNIYLKISQQQNINKTLPIQGTFLRAEIRLDLPTELLKIAESSMTMQAEIWLVDENSLLQKYKPNIAFSHNQYVYLTPPEQWYYPINLVSSPSTTLLEGMHVSTQNFTQENPHAQ